ncbi:MAG: ABC transporter ATP-binding protein, partial [Rhizobiaceae bacterium]
IEPSSGAIGFDGQGITHLPAYKRVRLGIAYTFQITSVFANLSVHDNVALAVQRVHADGRGRGALGAGIKDALSKVGLDVRASAPAGTLAYGHQRLLEIAMGLALKPRLLILDEPTQGLSDSEIEAFIKLIRELRKETTILLIEHNMQVVMRLADRITVLDAGKLLAEGSPRSIRANKVVQAAYLGSSEPGAAHG